MALAGDLNETRIQEKELIDSDLQKMGQSLQSLKTSVEKDATLLKKSDFSDLLQDIVTDLSAFSPAPDILILQNALQSQESLTVSVLDKIIQQFISIKLEYTANKSIYLTDVSLQKYKQLVEHRSAMDSLLLKISQTQTPESVPVNQEKETSVTPEVITPISETLDPDVIKIQQALIDGQKVVPIEGSKKEDDAKDEKKSFWDRAKDSSFGLAFVFGADRMTGAKEWVSDTWNTFKEWIGWKKKEKKQESNSESSPVVTESSELAPIINEGLTPEQVILRNNYIKNSVLDTTIVPVPIDYKTDKDLLLKQLSPEAISFDTTSQSIVLGNAKVKLSFPQFTMNVGGVNATVKKVDIRSIQVSGNDFVVEAKGTGSGLGIEQTKDIRTTLSKEKFYNLLQPYLETGSVKYDTSLEFEGQKVPLKLDVVGSIDPTPGLNQSDSVNFASYKRDIYNSYPESERKYLDTLSKHSADMYKNASTGLDKERLPALLQDYDADLLTGLDGGVLAIVGKQFPTVSELTKDSILGRAGNLANDVLGTIIGFLEKWEDNEVIGWLAKILKWAPDKLKNLIPNGNEQKQKALRSAVEKQMQDDPAIKNDMEKIVKQFSLVRFYFVEKKSLLEEKGIDASSFDGLSLPAAADFLQKQSILDASISSKTTLGLEANKVSVILENLIKNTDSDSDLSAERGKIVFNYKTNELESRGRSTKINVSKDGKAYQIDGFDIKFFNLQSVLRFANLSNRLIQQTSLSEKAEGNISGHFAYHTIGIKGPGLYINKRTVLPGGFGTIPGMDRDRIVRGSTFADNMPGWSYATGELYAKYLSNRITFFGGSLVS